MSGPRDDFIDALNYQVKEEVASRYFRERLILEEEINEYRESLRSYRQIEAGAGKARDYLACLLLTPFNVARFFEFLGFDAPPLGRVGQSALAAGPPSCPQGLTPRGFIKRTRYVNITLDTYQLFREHCAKGEEAANGLINLADEINGDIIKFGANFDLLGIIQFIKSFDQDMLVKKKFLGNNFSADEMGSLEHKLMFRKLDPGKDGVRPWPELPSRHEAEKRTSVFLGEIFQREREHLLPAVN